MKPTVRRLKNDIPVIFVPMKGARSMTFMVFTKVGSRYEEKDINGASHFIEHLMFKGTKRRRDALSISRELDRYGAEFNAFTGKDLTAYYVKMDAEHTPLAIDLLHDMLRYSKFDPKEMDRERGVIIEEINMYEDNPASQMSDLLEDAMFPGSTLGWNIAGPREVIRSVSRDALVAYRDRYYIPSRLSIVLSGSVHSDALALLERTFGTIEEPKRSHDQPFLPFTPPERLDESLAFQQKTIEQVQLGFGFYGLPYGHPDIPSLKLLGTILGSSMSSRLFTEIRERRGLCYSIQAGHQPFEDTGMFAITSGLAKDRVHEAVPAIWKELEKLKRDLVHVDELRRAKDYLRGKWSLAFEDSANQADWYGRQWTFESTLREPEALLSAIDAVKPSQIRNMAQQILLKDRLATAVVGPFRGKKEVVQALHFDALEKKSKIR